MMQDFAGRPIATNNLLNRTRGPLHRGVPLVKMIVTRLDRENEREPIGNEVGTHGCDFRPHFDGDLHSLSTTIYPLAFQADTEQRFTNVARTIADWIHANGSNMKTATDFISFGAFYGHSANRAGSCQD